MIVLQTWAGQQFRQHQYFCFSLFIQISVLIHLSFSSGQLSCWGSSLPSAVVPLFCYLVTPLVTRACPFLSFSGGKYTQDVRIHALAMQSRLDDSDGCIQGKSLKAQLQKQTCRGEMSRSLSNGRLQRERTSKKTTSFICIPSQRRLSLGGALLITVKKGVLWKCVCVSRMANHFHAGAKYVLHSPYSTVNFAFVSK